MLPHQACVRLSGPVVRGDPPAVSGGGSCSVGPRLDSRSEGLLLATYPGWSRGASLFPPGPSCSEGLASRTRKNARGGGGTTTSHFGCPFLWGDIRICSALWRGRTGGGLTRTTSCVCTADAGVQCRPVVPTPHLPLAPGALRLNKDLPLSAGKGLGRWRGGNSRSRDRRPRAGSSAAGG